MPDADPLLDIAHVVKLTGVTSRALRLYEQKGLLSPTRTYAGRRLYCAHDLARLHHIITFKALGLSLANIGKVLNGRLDGSALLDRQRTVLHDEISRLSGMLKTVEYVERSLSEEHHADTETLCDLINQGRRIMQDKPSNWAELYLKYFISEGGEEADLPPFDSVEKEHDKEPYSAQWRDLGMRIEQSLPLDPEGDTAQSFVIEWMNLLEPMRARCTPEQWRANYRMLDDMESWADENDDDLHPGFSRTVWDFMQLATAAYLYRLTLSPDNDKETQS